MTTPRVELLGGAEAAAEAKDVGLGGQLAALNLFRVLLRHPKIAKATADFLLELISGGALDHRLRELVIMRVGWVTRCDYEWTQHWTIAQLFECSPEDLLAVRDWEQSDRFGERERSVLAATDETLHSGSISPGTLERCKQALEDDRAVIELVLVIGEWRTVSELLRSFGIPLEENLQSWPPDGTGPI